MPDSTRPRMVAGSLLAAGFILFSCAQTAQAEGGKDFSFSTVRNMARAVAEKDFSPGRTSDLPDEFKKLSYDGYTQIRFREDHRLWKDDHLQLAGEFLHRGYLYNEPVKIDVVD